MSIAGAAGFERIEGEVLAENRAMPGDVLRQWRRWCLHPDYAVGDGEAVRAQYAAVRTPIVSLSFPHRAARHRRGHFGFFRPAFQNSLWRAHLLPEFQL